MMLWSRWTEIAEAWAEVQGRDPGLIETCKHCGCQFGNAHQRASHEARCGVAGVAPPLTMHEPKCRGTQEANLISGLCGEEFPHFGLPRVHEFDCTRLAKAAARPPPSPVPMMRSRRERQVGVTSVECNGQELNHTQSTLWRSELANLIEHA